MSKENKLHTLDEVWVKMIDDIEHLFQFQTLRYSQWMLLYTYIFDYCSKKNSDGANLYERIQDFLQNYLGNLCKPMGDLSDQDVLEFYLNLWTNYRRSSKIFHGICSYLNRHYVRRKCESGDSDMCEIFTLAMKTWQQVVSQLFYRQISQICLNMIQSERHNQKINTDILANTIQTYIPFDESLDIYQEYFEKQFLQEMQDFYRLEATTYIHVQNRPVMEYLSKIPLYMDEEIQRVTVYLHWSTVPKLEKKLEEVLIGDQLAVIYVEAKILIHEEKLEELNLLYRTVNRIENGKNGITTLLEDHIHQIGIETIENIHFTSTNDLEIYIQTISNLYQKYLTFIQKAFDQDQEFIKVLNRTFRRFVNNNSVIDTVGNTTIMAGSLARHCDKLLRKGENNDVAMEQIFDQIKILLYHMHEKDVFEKFYSKLLAKRLVNQTSISNDYEKLMIANIQNFCGFDYVSKMKQMCQDIETSQNALKAFLQSELTDHQIQFNILILNSNAWLFSKSWNIILPNRLELIRNNFNEFYNRLHVGRKLTWLYQYSKGELQTFFTKKVYTLQVSTYQMVILLLFNDSFKLTVEKIQDETQIKIELLLQILKILLESKILVSTDDTNLTINSIIQLSENFTNDKYRINLNTQIIKLTEDNDTEVVQKRIDRDRLMVIRAAIVRIMKSHRTMDQQLLIQTVIETLHSHFISNVAIIKNCVNALVEEEYLERQWDNADLLCYRL